MSAYIANTSHDSAWGTVICGSDDELGDEDQERRRARGRSGRDGGTAGGSCLRRSGAAHRRVDLLPGEASDGRAAVEASGAPRARIAAADDDDEAAAGGGGNVWGDGEGERGEEW